MIEPKGTHTITLDHSRCDHAMVEDLFCCDPIPTFACIAPPGDYCVHGCEDDPCLETGWAKGDKPGECSYGHQLVPHTCWVLPWLDSVSLMDTFVDVESLPFGFIYRDGPIDIVEWDQDYLVWAYPEATNV